MHKIRALFIVILIINLSACASMGSGSEAEKQQAILKMKDEALTHLFQEKPYARKQVESSVGYAVFSNANLNLFFVAAGTGYGLVKEMSTGKITYMNMAEGGVGLGLGAKDYRIVMAFHLKEAMDPFNNGWTFGGESACGIF